MAPMYFSRRDASTDMQHGIPGSRRDLKWPWPEVKIWPRLSKVNMHIFRRVSTTGTRWSPNYNARFLSSKVISEKTICVIWPLMTSGDLNVDLSEKLTKNSFEMIFNELSKAFSRFSLRRLGTELYGGRLDPPGRPRKFRSTGPARVKIIFLAQNFPPKACLHCPILSRN